MKIYKLLILFCILFIPGLIFLWYPKSNFKIPDLPFIGEKYLAENGKDTIYHTISDFNLIDQNGHVFNSDSIKNNFTIFNFFFSSCPKICPNIAQNINDLFKNKDINYYNDVKFISISVDPNVDKPEILNKFAKNYNIPNWSLLTGNYDEIKNLCKISFLLPIADEETKEKNNITHSEYLMLIDKDKRIRGMYSGLEKEDLKKMSSDIALLHSLEYQKKYMKKNK